MSRLEALARRGEVAEVARGIEAGDGGDRGLGLGEEVVDLDELAADRQVVGRVEVEDLAEDVPDRAAVAARAAQGEEEAVEAEGGVGRAVHARAPGSLAVSAQHVVHSRDGWEAAEGGVGSVMVVVVQPA
jgi:hypothetical protein